LGNERFSRVIWYRWPSYRTVKSLFTVRVFSQAEILCFAQVESGLQLAWRSPELDASARDLLADRVGHGQGPLRRRLARPRQAPGRRRPVARPVGQVRFSLRRCPNIG
jgi:hypothetical protein